jgi:hypothetical protein
VHIVGERLGRGSFGKAFRCIFQHNKYVIKVPNTLWNKRIIILLNINFFLWIFINFLLILNLDLRL